MKKNVGTTDAAVRIILAVTIAILYVAGALSGTAAIILGIIAAVLLVTGLTGFCPAYAIAGVSTKKRQ